MTRTRGWCAAGIATALTLAAACGGTPERGAEPAQPAAPAAAPETAPRLYISNETQGQVVVIDTAKLAPTMRQDEIIIVNLSGRGDKDVHTVAKMMGMEI